MYWCDVVLTYRSVRVGLVEFSKGLSRVLLRSKVGFRGLHWEVSISLLELMEAWFLVLGKIFPNLIVLCMNLHVKHSYHYHDQNQHTPTRSAPS